MPNAVRQRGIKAAHAPTPVRWRGARFLVPFFRAEKGQMLHCIGLRGMSANYKPQKSSGYQKLYYKSCFLYLKISAAWVFRLCGGQLLFVVPQKVTKKGTKEDRHNALRASACPPWNPPSHHHIFCGGRPPSQSRLRRASRLLRPSPFVALRHFPHTVGESSPEGRATRLTALFFVRKADAPELFSVLCA